MFSFFNEIKNKYKDISKKIVTYQCVQMGNYLLYVEGFSSLMTLTSETIVFRVNGGVLTVNGQGLNIKEMSPTTIIISGKILQVECL